MNRTDRLRVLWQQTTPDTTLTASCCWCCICPSVPWQLARTPVWKLPLWSFRKNYRPGFDYSGEKIYGISNDSTYFNKPSRWRRAEAGRYVDTLHRKIVATAGQPTWLKISRNYFIEPLVRTDWISRWFYRAMKWHNVFFIIDKGTTMTVSVWPELHSFRPWPYLTYANLFRNAQYILKCYWHNLLDVSNHLK